jgi:hypothetical protein
MFASPTLTVWSVAKGLPAPVAVLIGIIGFVVISAAWRTIRPVKIAQPLPKPAPPPPESNQELVNIRLQLADAKNELSRRDALAILAEAQKRETASLLSRAPKLWVDYKPRNPTEGEALIFSKEGDAAIRTIHVCPLVWRTIKKYPINLLSAIGPLRTQPVECRFAVFEQIGEAQMPQMLYELPDLFQEMIHKFGQQTQPSVDILYEDFDGNWFCRAFGLSIDPYSQIVWKPDVVQLAKEPIS